MIDSRLDTLSDAKRALLQQRMRGRQGAGERRDAPHGNGTTQLAVVQEPLWYFSQLAPDLPVYNEAFAIRKHGEIDVDALRAAFNAVVRRHDAWRSTFHVEDGEPRLVVADAPEYQLPLVDLSVLPVDEAEREATRIVATEATGPYDLERGPLLRPLLVRVSNTDHRLYVALHHLIFDGGSLSQTVLPELIAFYDAFVAGSTPALAADPAQYGEFVAWEREWTDSPQFARRLDYWQQQLDGAPALQLPTDHPRLARQVFRGGTEAIDIDAARARQLRDMARTAGATLFQVMASTFAVLLHSYSGQDDLVFGTVANMRQRSQHAHVVGYCVTPLVLRLQLADDPPFTALVDRVRDTLIDALDNKVPFQRLVRHLNPPREAGANPLIQVLFVLEPPASATASPWTLDLTVPALNDTMGYAKFDIAVELDERPGGAIAGRVIFNTDIFDRDTIRHLLTHWDALLGAVVDDATRRISALPILSEEEVHRQLVEWNATEGDLSLDRCLHELVADQARRTPDAVAVSDRHAALTFAALDDDAGRLASYLRALGVRPDAVVGICLERSTTMVLALLAVLKAGGAFLPLEPDQPAERLAAMVADARPAVIITTARSAASLRPSPARRVDVDADRPVWSARAPVSDAGCAPDNLAYVLFTSGSAGAPKGVMIEHRSVVNNLAWRVDAFGLSASDRLLQKTPLGFDPSVWEIFAPLIAGASLTILDPGEQLDAHRLADAVVQAGITVLSFVPTMLEEFLAVVDPSRCTSLRLVTSGGEITSPALVDAFFERFAPGDGGVALRNSYGPTETAISATSWLCQAGSDVIPIGRPVANTRVYILGPQLTLLPTGVVGELCIGGVQVGRGYINRPELTAERFVADPFVPGERLYRTGDLARYRRDGAIEFLGRRDGQVKIRGVRVELAEVEAAVATHPAVRHAVADVRRDGADRPRLVAYVVTGDGSAPTAAELRPFVADRLPAAMIPSVVVGIEAIPLTHSGKVDRNALPDPDWRPNSGFREPRSDTEAALVAVWAQTLGVGSVGIDDDFFELGGHSLLAVRLLAGVERALGHAVPLATFFECATVAGMAAALESTESGENAQRVVAQSGRAAAPLFFIHPNELTLLTLRHFREPLGPGQRIIGLLPDRDQGRFDRSSSIEELAARLLTTIRGVQPVGPYYIAGFSMGGLLAYEVAGQLRTAGEDVAWLAVLDTMTPEVARRLRWLRSPRGILTRLRERGARRAVLKVARAAKRVVDDRRKGQRGQPPPFEDEFDWEGAAALTSRYVCSSNDVRMELFVSEDVSDNARNVSLGWMELHGGVLTAHKVPGKHLSLVTEPHVREVAEILSASLRQAQARAAATS